MLESLAEVLPRAAERFGDRRALVAGDRSFSFTVERTRGEPREARRRSR
jgi:hypothetical protein